MTAGISVANDMWAVLAEENGKTYVVELVDSQTKVKGLGVFNPATTLQDVGMGDTVIIGQRTSLG